MGNRLEIQVDRPQILIGHESVHRPRHDLEDAIAFISDAKAGRDPAVAIAIVTVVVVACP